MQQSFVDVGHEVADFLACGADRVIVVIENYTHLVHEADLFFIIAGEVVIFSSLVFGAVRWKVGADEAGVHFRE